MKRLHRRGCIWLVLMGVGVGGSLRFSTFRPVFLNQEQPSRIFPKSHSENCINEKQCNEMRWLNGWGQEPQLGKKGRNWFKALSGPWKMLAKGRMKIVSLF